MVAIDANASASWIGGAAALSLLSIAIAFNFRNQIQNAREHKATEATCRWQISVLVEVLDKNGIPMPPKFWLEPPKESHKKQDKKINEDDGTISSPLLAGVSLAILIFLATVLVINVFIIVPIRNLQPDKDTAECYQTLNNDYYIAVANVLLSSPSPSPQRDLAVDDLNFVVAKLRNRVVICEDGDPYNNKDDK